jgi:RimJ/RimL family protein N-acetyltransferase
MKVNSIQLRHAQWEDMPIIRDMWSDEDTMRPVGGPVVLTNEEAKDWFARKIDPGNPSDCYRLIMNQQGCPVGEISYRDLDPETGRWRLIMSPARSYCFISASSTIPPKVMCSGCA